MESLFLRRDHNRGELAADVRKPQAFLGISNTDRENSTWFKIRNRKYLQMGP